MWTVAVSGWQDLRQVFYFSWLFSAFSNFDNGPLLLLRVKITQFEEAWVEMQAKEIYIMSLLLFFIVTFPWGDSPSRASCHSLCGYIYPERTVGREPNTRRRVREIRHGRNFRVKIIHLYQRCDAPYPLAFSQNTPLRWGRESDTWMWRGAARLSSGCRPAAVAVNKPVGLSWRDSAQWGEEGRPWGQDLVRPPLAGGAGWVEDMEWELFGDVEWLSSPPPQINLFPEERADEKCLKTCRIFQALKMQHAVPRVLGFSSGFIFAVSAWAGGAEGRGKTVQTRVHPRCHHQSSFVWARHTSWLLHPFSWRSFVLSSPAFIGH